MKLILSEKGMKWAEKEIGGHVTKERIHGFMLECRGINSKDEDVMSYLNSMSANQSE